MSLKENEANALEVVVDFAKGCVIFGLLWLWLLVLFLFVVGDGGALVQVLFQPT